MHRIDGPGATVDNKFTEGDPVGGVPATVVTGPWLNDIQEELISLLAAAGITPVKGSQAQVLQAIRKLGAGVVGAMRNGRMSVSTVSASATYTADEVVLKSALGGLAWLIPSFNKSINLATVGAGGMDLGAAPVSSFVGIYAIYNPTTQVSALLAVNATNVRLPGVYGGTNMPTGYTASCLLTVVSTNASGQFKVQSVRDRKVSVPVYVAYSTTSITAVTLVAVGLPYNALGCSGYFTMGSTVSGQMSMTVTSGESTTVLPGQRNFTTYVLAATTASGSFYNCPTNDAGSIVVATSNATGGTPSFSLNISEYEI